MYQTSIMYTTMVRCSCFFVCTLINAGPVGQIHPRPSVYRAASPPYQSTSLIMTVEMSLVEITRMDRIAFMLKKKKNETGKVQPFGDSRRTWNEAHAETEQEEQGRRCALHYVIYEPKPTTAAVFGSRYINLKIFHIRWYVCLPILVNVAHNYT